MMKRDQGLREHDLDQLCLLFRLLADKTRLAILMRLSTGECNVTTLCEELHLPQPTVSHHLGLLRLNNLVGHRRHGKQIYYGLYGPARQIDGRNNIMAFDIEHLNVQVQRRQR